MVHSLFGPQCQHRLHGLLEMLERDLMESLSLHSLTTRCNLFPGSVSVPLMVGGGQADTIVDPTQIQSWQPWLKPGDRLWICPKGRHFFYATHPQITAAAMLDFWQEWETNTPSAMTV
jgi:pimeloyl-ACP methyl ester carboxylesterase